MLVRVLRILLAFALACFAAALTLVLFVLTPAEIQSLPAGVRADRVGSVLQLALPVAVHIALFSAPLVLVSIAISEMLGIRRWIYHALTGLLVSGLGFFAQRSAEQIGQPTIVNNYALTAFLVSGFVGGLAYWIFAGRFAGQHPRIAEPPQHDAGSPDARSESGSATAASRAK